MPNPSAPDRYAVIGHPIAHSKSPDIHHAFAAQTGQSLVYERIEGRLDAFADDVNAFRAQGGRGMNVTLPFKVEAFALATHRHPSAQRAGAANALRFVGDRIEAQNFDGIGLVRDIEHNLGLPLAGQRVLLLGAGGAARGAVPALLEAGASSVWIANRTAAKAQALAQDFHVLGAVQGCSFEALADTADAGGFALVLNSTAASLQDAPLPLHPALWRGTRLAYDMAYGRGLTPFLRQAQDAEVAQLADGVGMLVEQAAEAFAWWRGVRPDTRAVIAALSVPLQ
jgi:shikimate dehydrogenase